MNISVILGHPYKDSFNAAMAAAAVEILKEHQLVGAASRHHERVGGPRSEGGSSLHLSHG